MTKVVALSGSPKKNGNTVQAINVMREALAKHNIEVETICVGHLKIHGCLACGTCTKNRDERCVTADDEVNEIIQKLKAADGIILASPVYFAGISGPLKSVLDRAFYVAGMNNGLFKHKASAAVAVARRAGTTSAYTQLTHYLSYAQTFMAPSTYWPIIYGAAPGEVLADLEGVQTLITLAENMAYIIKTQQPELLYTPGKKAYTNFIR